LVADTSGAYIPGHGTPTVIIVARRQRAIGSTVRAVLGVRGEPGRPNDPADGVVWAAIVNHVDAPGWDDGWVTIADLDRGLLASHPWSLSGGGAVPLLETLNAVGSSLASRGADIGMTDFTGEDDVFVSPLTRSPRGCEPWLIPIVEGDDVRDHLIENSSQVLLPNEMDGRRREPTAPVVLYLWPFRTKLRNRLYFGQTPEARGKRWFDHGIFFPKRHLTPLSIAFAFVATHNHFALDRGGRVFKQSAPVIKLPEETESDHAALLGALNSSTACFWLKQNCHNKGSTVDSKGAPPDTGALGGLLRVHKHNLARLPVAAGSANDVGTGA